MTGAALGALLGLGSAAGGWLIVTALARSRRPSLDDRVLPYLHDLPQAPRMVGGQPSAAGPTAVGWVLFGPSVRRLAVGVERVLGGAASVRRRLERLGSGLTVEQFRVQQAVWGLGGFSAMAAIGVLWSLSSAVAPIPMLTTCAVAFALGVLARDQALSTAVRRREERMLTEFPTVADLLALSVAAGEGPVAALERVVAVSHGTLSLELRTLLSQVRTGVPIGRALDRLSAVTGVPVIARFAEGLAIALDRGTPLVDVLHAQAADVREAGRRSLIEQGARKEVAMMLPVVFLILPVTVLFAFFPGVIGLHLSSN
ncbi:MAG: type II secretion system F family protein [Nocardioidaceae bacterium]